VRYTIGPLLGSVRAERAGGWGVSDAERARTSSEELGMGRTWIDAFRGSRLDAVTDAPRAPRPVRCRASLDLRAKNPDRPADFTQSNTYTAITAGCGPRGTAQVCNGAIGG
jgi:hypothetical protein